MLDADSSPQSRVCQHHKDVSIILSYERANGLELPLSRAHVAILESTLAAGDGDLDNSAVIREIRRPIPRTCSSWCQERHHWHGFQRANRLILDGLTRLGYNPRAKRVAPRHRTRCGRG